MSKRTANLVAALFLSVHAALLGFGATQHSPSIDEVGHMAAGLSHWHFGRFDLYKVNPPLVRLAATTPVALLRPATDWNGYSLLPGTRPEFECGERFIQANGERSFFFFTVARWACIPFSLLGGYVCFRWAGELYGAAGGLLSLSLWCFGPNILAHAQMITPDVGAAALGAAACYMFWRWLRRPTWGGAFMAGIVLGAAELTKTTFLLLYAAFPLMLLSWRAGGAVEAFQTGNLPLRRSSQLALMMALSLYLLNLGYVFEATLRPLGEFNFISESLGGTRDMTPRESGRRNRFAESPLASVPVPLPANYVLGIDHQKSDFERGFPSYLRGQWRHGGWWYYYLYGVVIKMPLGTWIVFLLAAGVRVAEIWKWPRLKAQVRAMHPQPNRLPEEEGEEGHRHEVERVTWRDEVVLLLPAVAILALVSSQTGFNHHLRYVLPIFPFVFIWIGRLGPYVDLGVRQFVAAFRRRKASLPRQERISTSAASGEMALAEREDGSATRESGDGSPRSKIVAAVTAAALAWSIGSSLWYYPHSLSYFNELVGGPLGGRWHLLDSNIDWGQDLLYLKDWAAEHPEAKPLGLAYFGYFDPRTAGIQFTVPPRGPAIDESEEDAARGDHRTPAADEIGPLPGWYAVSVMMLHGYKYGIPDGKGGKFYTDRPYFTYFQHFEPVARAGYSIYIYHLLPAEVDRVRRELGLPPLNAPPEAVTK